MQVPIPGLVPDTKSERQTTKSVQPNIVPEGVKTAMKKIEAPRGVPTVASMLISLARLIVVFGGATAGVAVVVEESAKTAGRKELKSKRGSTTIATRMIVFLGLMGLEPIRA